MAKWRGLSLVLLAILLPCLVLSYGIQSEETDEVAEKILESYVDFIDQFYKSLITDKTRVAYRDWTEYVPRGDNDIKFGEMTRLANDYLVKIYNSLKEAGNDISNQFSDSSFIQEQEFIDNFITLNQNTKYDSDPRYPNLYVSFENPDLFNPKHREMSSYRVFHGSYFNASKTLKKLHQSVIEKSSYPFVLFTDAHDGVMFQYPSIQDSHRFYYTDETIISRFRPEFRQQYSRSNVLILIDQSDSYSTKTKATLRGVASVIMSSISFNSLVSVAFFASTDSDAGKQGYQFIPLKNCETTAQKFLRQGSEKKLGKFNNPEGLRKVLDKYDFTNTYPYVNKSNKDVLLNRSMTNVPNGGEEMTFEERYEKDMTIPYYDPFSPDSLVLSDKTKSMYKSGALESVQLFKGRSTVVYVVTPGFQNLSGMGGIKRLKFTNTIVFVRISSDIFSSNLGGDVVGVFGHDRISYFMKSNGDFVDPTFDETLVGQTTTEEAVHITTSVIATDTDRDIREVYKGDFISENLEQEFVDDETKGLLTSLRENTDRLALALASRTVEVGGKTKEGHFSNGESSLLTRYVADPTLFKDDITSKYYTYKYNSPNETGSVCEEGGVEYTGYLCDFNDLYKGLFDAESMRTDLEPALALLRAPSGSYIISDLFDNTNTMQTSITLSVPVYENLNNFKGRSPVFLGVLSVSVPTLTSGGVLGFFESLPPDQIAPEIGYLSAYTVDPNLILSLNSYSGFTIYSRPFVDSVRSNEYTINSTNADLMEGVSQTGSENSDYYRVLGSSIVSRTTSTCLLHSSECAVYLKSLTLPESKIYATLSPIIPKTILRKSAREYMEYKRVLANDTAYKALDTKPDQGNIRCSYLKDISGLSVCLKTGRISEGRRSTTAQAYEDIKKLEGYDKHFFSAPCLSNEGIMARLYPHSRFCVRFPTFVVKYNANTLGLTEEQLNIAIFAVVFGEEDELDASWWSSEIGQKLYLEPNFREDSVMFIYGFWLTIQSSPDLVGYVLLEQIRCVSSIGDEFGLSAEYPKLCGVAMKQGYFRGTSLLYLKGITKITSEALSADIADYNCGTSCGTSIGQDVKKTEYMITMTRVLPIERSPDSIGVISLAFSSALSNEIITASLKSIDCNNPDCKIYGINLENDEVIISHLYRDDSFSSPTKRLRFEDLFNNKLVLGTKKQKLSSESSNVSMGVEKDSMIGYFFEHNDLFKRYLSPDVVHPGVSVCWEINLDIEKIKDIDDISMDSRYSLYRLTRPIHCVGDVYIGWVNETNILFIISYSVDCGKPYYIVKNGCYDGNSLVDSDSNVLENRNGSLNDDPEINETELSKWLAFYSSFTTQRNEFTVGHLLEYMNEPIGEQGESYSYPIVDEHQILELNILSISSSMYFEDVAICAVVFVVCVVFLIFRFKSVCKNKLS